MERFYSNKQHTFQPRAFLTDRSTSPSTENWFRYESTTPPTLKDLIRVQMELGFDPRGYGGPSNVSTDQPYKLFITTWSCAGSCD